MFRTFNPPIRQAQQAGSCFLFSSHPVVQESSLFLLHPLPSVCHQPHHDQVTIWICFVNMELSTACASVPGHVTLSLRSPDLGEWLSCRQLAPKLICSAFYALVPFWLCGRYPSFVFPFEQVP
jgi:hypothetical protein